MKTRIRPALFVLLCGALLYAGASAAATLNPARHADFDHYTLALTWQPGFCGTDGGCRPDQPQKVLIGLHGLWASRPASLVDAGVSASKWWHEGCDYFHHSDRAPEISASIRRSLKAVMPHLSYSLLRHEYGKHVQCFGFDTEHFFVTALRMRRSIASSAFGRYLDRRASGHRVTRKHVIGIFMRAFNTNRHHALQLRCGTDRHGRTVLTQLWITLHADAVADFPGKRSLMDAPVGQGICPARFLVPAWRS